MTGTVAPPADRTLRRELFFFLAGGVLLARLPVRRAIAAAGNRAPELV